MCGDKIHQGGGVAAPIASQVLGEVLPYLEIKKDNDEEGEKQEVEVPNVVGMTKKEAKNVLEENGLNIDLRENNNENIQNTSEEKSESIVSNQLPKAGVKIKEGTSVIVELNN